MEDRQCRFKFEQDSVDNFLWKDDYFDYHYDSWGIVDYPDRHILREFSVSGCFFECWLKIAYNRCSCLPWYYPLDRHFLPPSNINWHKK